LPLASAGDANENRCEKGADRINNAGDVTSMLFGYAADDVLYCDSRDLCIMLLTLYFDCNEKKYALNIKYKYMRKRERERERK